MLKLNARLKKKKKGKSLKTHALLSVDRFYCLYTFSIPLVIEEKDFQETERRWGPKSSCLLAGALILFVFGLGINFPALPTEALMKLTVHISVSVLF